MRLIDADAIVKCFDPNTWQGEMMIAIVNGLPTIDPVKHGEWVGVAHGRGGHECSKCRGYAPSFQNGVEYLSNYCPNCGAKMEGAE